MPNIYAIDAHGVWTGATREIGPKEGRPRGWIASDTPPPEGAVVQWAGEWRVLTGADLAQITEARRVKAFSLINAERERRLASGSAFPVAGIADPVPLQGRPFDQTVYLALLTRASGYKAAGITDPILTLRDAADVIHALTPDQMIDLVAQAMAWFEGVMAASWSMKDGTGAFTGGIPFDFTDDRHWP